MERLVLCPEYLGAGDLARCRAVCKDWNSLIREAALDALTLSISQHNPQVWILCSCNDNQGKEGSSGNEVQRESREGNEGEEEEEEEEEVYDLWSPDVRIRYPLAQALPDRAYASHHGLVLCVDVMVKEDIKAWVGNPMTGVWKQLPPPPFLHRYTSGWQHWGDANLIVDPTSWSYKVITVPSPYGGPNSEGRVFDSTTWTWQTWINTERRLVELAQIPEFEDENQVLVTLFGSQLDIYDLNKINLKESSWWCYKLEMMFPNVRFFQVLEVFYYKGSWIMAAPLVQRESGSSYEVFKLDEKTAGWKRLNGIKLEDLFGQGTDWWEKDFRPEHDEMPKVHVKLHGDTLVFYSFFRIPQVSFNLETGIFKLHTPVSGSNSSTFEVWLEQQTRSRRYCFETAFVPSFDARP